jgi:predicted phosphohydrolase
MAIKIDCISDLHGSYPLLDGGDLLLIAGDITASDRLHQYGKFFEWLAHQNYRKKVLIGGNHDGYFTGINPKEAAKELVGMGADDFEYLCDSACEFEGYKIWGAPWTPIFYDWHFMLNRREIAKKWALIPEDTDILVTHGPPFGTLDTVSPRRTHRCGCEELALRLKELHNLKLHVFGHIHGGYGQKVTYPELKTPCPHSEGQTFYRYTSVNCAIMDEDYRPVNAPITVIM